jgi:seryl-tRNA synthetase
MIERAERTRAAAAEELEAAKAKIAEVEHLFDGDPSKHRRAAVLEAKVDLERAERALRRSVEALASTRTVAAKMLREEQTRELAQLEARLEEWQAAIEAAAARLVEVDIGVEAIVVDLAKATATAAETHGRAASIASEIGHGTRFASTPRPTLAEARLRATRMVTAARIESARQALAPAWLAQADLTEAGWNAEELANIRAMRQRQNGDVATERAGLAFAAGVAAAKNAATTQESKQ